jgi:DNA-binding NtrC family response regulator
MRILVTEDDPRLADFLCQELQKEQFVVQVVADGIEAQELALNQHYDLVILGRTSSMSTLTASGGKWISDMAAHSFRPSARLLTRSVKTPSPAGSWRTVQRYRFS